MSLDWLALFGTPTPEPYDHASSPGVVFPPIGGTPPIYSPPPASIPGNHDAWTAARDAKLATAQTAHAQAAADQLPGNGVHVPEWLSDLVSGAGKVAGAPLAAAGAAISAPFDALKSLALYGVIAGVGIVLLLRRS